MLYINKITNDPSQQLTLTGISNLTISMTLQFCPRTETWIMGIDDGTNLIEGISVVSSLNILRQWQNIIPYGIACVCASGLDPYRVGDFASQFANLYLLNSDDVIEIEADWFT